MRGAAARRSGVPPPAEPKRRGKALPEGRTRRRQTPDLLLFGGRASPGSCTRPKRSAAARHMFPVRRPHPRATILARVVSRRSRATATIWSSSRSRPARDENPGDRGRSVGQTAKPRLSTSVSRPEVGSAQAEYDGAQRRYEEQTGRCTALPRPPPRIPTSLAVASTHRTLAGGPLPRRVRCHRGAPLQS